MKFLKVEELKIFLTFFILYSLFIHWVGWNEETRLLAAISIIEKNTFDINAYANFTGDRILVNGKYYSDKAPGISLFLSPIYFIFKISFKDQFGNNKYVLVPQPQFNTTVYFIEGNLEKSVLMTKIFGVILLSSLVGALSVVLFRRILLFYFNKNTSLILSIVFGLSSLVFPYSTVLMGTSFSLFLLLLSFYVLQKDYRQKYVIGGILLGLSFIVDYTSILVILPLIFFIWNKTSTSEKIKLFLSSVLGILPLFVYSFSVFNNPIGFLTYQNFIDPSIYPCTYGKKYFEFCPEPLPLSLKSLPDISLELALKILHLFIFPYRGIIFYNPFLLFFIVSLFLVFKRNRQLFYFSIFAFLFSIVSVSFYSYWFGGSSFGPRYLVNSLPLMILPIGYLLEDEKFKRRKILIVLFSLSILISTFHMFLSTAADWEGVIVVFTKTRAYLYANWYEKSFFATSFRKLNPLYQHYLPAFLDNGPRSRILEFLLASKIPDIRDFRQIPYKEIKIFTSPHGFVVLKVPFLSFVLFVFVFILIWNKELKQHKLIGISLRELIIVIVLLLLLSRIEFKYIAFGKGWMPRGINETARWSSKSGEIYIFSPIERDVILNVSLLNYRGKTLEFYINDNLINTYISPESILEIVKLKKGENKLLLLSKEDCEIPLYVENQLKCSNIVECMKLNTTIFKLSFDARCLSFGVANISIVPLETFLTQNISIAYGSGFYPQEKYGRWMSNNSVLYIYSPQTRIAFLNISFDGYQNVSLSAFLNNNFIGSFHAQTFFERVILKEGINELRFISDSCIVPAYVLNGSNDYRCLTKVLRNITIVDKNDLKPGIYFGSNWYDGYWMSKNASFYIYSDKDEKTFLDILLSTYKNITFVLLLNNKTIGEFQGYRFFEPVAINKGLNKLTIISNGCYIPAFEEKNSSDLRCLSLAVKNISLIDMAKLRKPEVYFGSGWYDEEKYSGRWASKKATLYIYSDEEKTVFFNISVPYYKAEDIKLILNNQSLGDFKVQSLFVPLTLKKGLNKLELYPDKCEIPAYLENNSKDFRCLSFFVRNISLIDLDELKEIVYFGSGWHEKEENGRWMSSSSIIYLVRQLNYSKFSLEIESFMEPRKLFIEVNGKSYVFNIPVGKPQKISLILSPANLTQVKLETYPACEVPGKGDNRCLSLFFRNFSLENLKNIEYFNFFDEEKYNEIKFRWFSTDSKVYVLSNETNLFLLKFNAWAPPNQRRILKIYVNGIKINEYNISETMMSINLPVVLRKGINEIVFLADSCVYVAKDTRCLGAAISEIQKEDINIQNIENFSRGFYGLEKAYGSYFRWFSEEGEIRLFSSQSTSLKLYVKIGWSYFSDRNLNITLNNKLIFAQKIAKNGKEFSISLDLVEGWNSLSFASTCDIPARLEFSEDKRCLSLAFMNLSFLAFGS
jgi:4-amino-4-deoxy-L-arabinose transferase-like glycosyltransferase